jgi:hypothetical protein
MQPRVSGGQALLAALNGLGELGDVNVIEMGAGGHLVALLKSSLEGGQSFVD